jgi:hypothetical protein
MLDDKSNKNLFINFYKKIKILKPEKTRLNQKKPEKTRKNMDLKF